MEPQGNQRLGHYVTASYGDEIVRAYVPPPLPPFPPLDLAPQFHLYGEASRALGQLDGLTSVLPDLPLFLYAYVRKEAVFSSQIEGTQSSLSDLLLFENEETPGAPLEDVREVSNYIAALEHGMTRLREGFPLSLRLLREIHAILLREGRGSAKEPGEFRRSQNWIGGSRPGNAAFVPPPPHLLTDCLGRLEHFLHADIPSLPVLLRAGLAHVQFETIHPFLDGNGRLGRLLITFLLWEGQALREPILYLSLYFKTHRSTYYDLLNRVRTHGDWETWIEFFLSAVRETSTQAVFTARRILALIEDDRRKIEVKGGRSAATLLQVFHHAQRRPVFSIRSMTGLTKLSFPTVSNATQELSALGIFDETTQKRWGRLYSYARYLTILAEDTEPLPRG